MTIEPSDLVTVSFIAAPAVAVIGVQLYVLFRWPELTHRRLLFVLGAVGLGLLGMACSSILAEQVPKRLARAELTSRPRRPVELAPREHTHDYYGVTVRASPDCTWVTTYMDHDQLIPGDTEGTVMAYVEPGTCTPLYLEESPRKNGGWPSIIGTSICLISSWVGPCCLLLVSLRRYWRIRRSLKGTSWRSRSPKS